MQIVDQWHAREHVWKVARAVFGPESPQAAAWAEQACARLLQGRIEDVVTEQRCCHTCTRCWSSSHVANAT